MANTKTFTPAYIQNIANSHKVSYTFAKLMIKHDCNTPDEYRSKRSSIIKERTQQIRENRKIKKANNKGKKKVVKSTGYGR